MVIFTQRIFRPTFLLLLVFLVSYSVYAGGTLDPNFGTGGKVSFHVNGTDFARAALLQPDGKIVMVGSSNLPGQSGGFQSFAVARLNADGTLDSAFGTNGKVLTDFGSLQEDAAQAVALQPDGKIVVGGYTGGNGIFAIVRYNADGSLDTSFDGGKVTTDFEGSVSEKISNVFVLPDGKILAVGGCSGAFPLPPARIGLARYNTDGTLDTGFGSNGKFLIEFSSFYTRFGGAAVQPDGKILITGEYGFNLPGCVPSKTVNCGRSQSFLLRYTTQMNFDRKFGRRLGKEFTKYADVGDTLNSISLESDGDILITGTPVPRRYTRSGRLETTFARVPQTFHNLAVRALAQRPDGKVAGCGVDRLNNHDDIVTALFNSDGSLIGFDRCDFFEAEDSCSAVLAQPDGKILVIGYAQIAPQSSYRFAAMRYLDITP